VARAALRYSPIHPAYLMPGGAPPKPPAVLMSLAFFFCQSPYKMLGRIKPELNPTELEGVYFTQGLASIVCVNYSPERSQELRGLMDSPILEYWPLSDSCTTPTDVIVKDNDVLIATVPQLSFDADAPSELAVYVEQILACLVVLQESYAIYNPGELRTLERVLAFTKRLICKYVEVSARPLAMENRQRCNQIAATLVELSASLSYAVTQGASGCSPILENRSPFPQFSLLGIGGSVRAITKFTRYLESAFAARNASEVIAKEYSCRDTDVPVRISLYTSGQEYKLRPDDTADEEFDRGGSFQQVNDCPLIAYFSLRHGFKESKLSLTAAAESLTDEVSPQWTMMTLSHEIMHNRVRSIFQKLFGSSWEHDRDSALTEQHYLEYKEWYESRGKAKKFNLDCVLRNVVLNFCCARDRATDVRRSRRSSDEQEIPGLEVLSEIYCRQRLHAEEIFVHFHDYYFSYAAQQHMYIMSLWASWIKVAAPYARPMEYLVRTLVTVACGCGLDPEAAFEGAAEKIENALTALEQKAKVQSPLFVTLQHLLGENKEAVYTLFKPAYYLIDHVRRFFASREIAKRIDRIEADPFAQGSTAVEEYSASVFVYGEDDPASFVSPIRYSLASFLRSISGESPIADRNWLTAWNTMVISSQEIQL